MIDNLELRKIKIIKSWLIYNGPICFFFRRECLPLEWTEKLRPSINYNIQHTSTQNKHHRINQRHFRCFVIKTDELLCCVSCESRKGKGKRKPLLRIQIHSKARRLWTWWLVIEATLQSNSGQNVGLHRAPFFWLWWIHPCNLQASGGVKKSIVSSTSFEADQNYNHGNCAWWRQKF